MTSRRLHMLTAFVLPLATSASLLAAPIGRPGLPPCSPEGICKPSGAWGYTQTAWRTWPGTVLDQQGGAEESAMGRSEIRPTDKPNPNREDQLAPPKVEALDDQVDSRPTEDKEGEFKLPPREDFEEGEAAGPVDEPNRVAPPRPGFMDRAPGELPTGERPPRGALPEEPALPFGQPPADLFPSNTGSPHVDGPSLGGDAPPPMPVGLSPRNMQRLHVLPVPQHVLPAAATVDPRAAASYAMPIPARAATNHGIQRAGGITPLTMPSVDVPPAMPGSLHRTR